MFFHNRSGELPPSTEGGIPNRSIFISPFESTTIGWRLVEEGTRIGGDTDPTLRYSITA